MTEALQLSSKNALLNLPALIAREDPRCAERFVEFFVVTIRNSNTRAAYACAISQFLNWCERQGANSLHEITPLTVAAYIEQHTGAVLTVKQHLSALNRMFDWLVTGQILQINPAASVRSPRYSLRKGKTPVLTADEARQLFDAISTETVTGLRDRALVAVMVYSFARVSAAVNMQVRDYYPFGKRRWMRLHEKGGKFHEVPVHTTAEEYLNAYLKIAGIEKEKNSPLFRSVKGKTNTITDRAMTRIDAYKMIRRRASAAGLSAAVCCHSFRATGITAYLEAGGKLEHAQAIAAHESPRTTELYDRTSNQINLNEIERIRI